MLLNTHHTMPATNNNKRRRRTFSDVSIGLQGGLPTLQLLWGSRRQPGMAMASRQHATLLRYGPIPNPFEALTAG
jgi:hypothetical protein